MKSFSVTDIGLRRSVNQDSVYCNENEIGPLSNLFIVADGWNLLIESLIISFN